MALPAGSPAEQRHVWLIATLFQLQNDLETQRRATEFAFRKRSHHEEQALGELQWQMKKVEFGVSIFLMGASTGLKSNDLSAPLFLDGGGNGRDGGRHPGAGHRHAG